jgi:hypothetical protein
VLNASHNSLSSIQAVTGLQALNALILSGEPTDPYSWHARQMVCLLCLVQKTIRIMSLTTEPGRWNASSMINWIGMCPSQNALGFECIRLPAGTGDQTWEHGPRNSTGSITRHRSCPPGCDPETVLQHQSRRGYIEGLGTFSHTTTRNICASADGVAAPFDLCLLVCADNEITSLPSLEHLGRLNTLGESALDM